MSGTLRRAHHRTLAEMTVFTPSDLILRDMHEEHGRPTSDRHHVVCRVVDHVIDTAAIINILFSRR
jgi:hypothetical protein